MKSLTTDRLMTLVDGIYAASIDAREWQGTLTRLADTMGGNLGTLVIYDRRNPGSAVVETLRFDLDIERRFVELREQGDEWHLRALHRPRGRALIGSDLIPTREFRRLPIYASVAGPQGIEYMVGGYVEHGENRMLGISVLGGRRRGDFGEQDRRFLDALFPHLRRAGKIHERLHSASLRLDGLFATLSATREPLLVVDSDLRLLVFNEAAERLLAGVEAVRVVSGRLALQDLAAQRRLESQVRSAVGAGGDHDSLIVRDRAGRPIVSLVVCPVPRQSQRRGPAGPEHFVVSLRPLAMTRRTVSEAARRKYGFTPAESMIAADLIEGLAPRDIADRRGVSIETIRTQLKRLLAKAGASTQSQLLLRLLALREGD